MGKRPASIFILVLLAMPVFSLTGCADFVGLDEISIVAGIAIDRSEDNPDDLHLTLEIVDASAKGDQQGNKTYLVESEGPTIQAAISNANKFQSKEMYFGNAELLIIQQSLAQNMGVDPILESFLRNLDTRDTLQIVISLEETAGELFSNSKDIDGVVSYVVARSLGSQKNQANSTNAVQIYEMYNDLRHKHICPTLPFFHGPASKEGELVIDGLAIFRKDKLVGKISNDEMKFFMFITEKLNGGSYSFALPDGSSGEITAEILKSTPKLSTDFDGEKFNLSVSVDVTATVQSASPLVRRMEDWTVSELERACEAALAADIEALINRVRGEMICDAFGFGTQLYAHDPALWKKVETDWIYYFRDGSLSVTTKVKFEHTGMIGGF